MRYSLWIHLLAQLALVLLVLGEPNRTELHNAVDRVFSRQKRFVLFPMGSNLKFTCSISAGLLSRFPRGVSMNLEEAVYYPVPTSRADVYPKRFRPRTTTTPVPKTSTEPTYVWIAGTDWRFKATPIKKPTPVRLHQRIDHRPPVPSYADPAKWKQWSKYGEHYKNWTPARPYEKYGQPGRWSKWTTQSPAWSNYGKRWYRSAESQLQEEPDEDLYDPDMTPYKPTHYPDLEHARDWQDYHGHRDRRQLFENFGAFGKHLGIETKACILRAICDSKRLLLPPGYSMLQDIVRVIFTLPTISGVEDDYSRIMRMTAEDCDKHFKHGCKLNLLGWLLDAKWGQ
ncbi:uncharacterized protein LOC108659845 [Drosophila navojoa]|nr:uncharacterized protein LOC108659845 [Drosophila navojoa]